MQIDFVTFLYGKLLPTFRRNRHLFPLFEFQNALRKNGLKLHFLTLEDLLSTSGAGVLCLDSRIFTYQDGMLCESHLEQVKRLSMEYEKVLWFDNRDSSGTTQFEVLPFSMSTAKSSTFAIAIYIENPCTGDALIPTLSIANMESAMII